MRQPPPASGHAPPLDRHASWAAPERRYRPEIHGLRGFAILGVVLFHLFGAGRVSGGIDIFLAISGFLFTAMLLREAVESGGTIRVGRYLARLARRLLPAAALVILVTTLAGLLLFPETRHAQLLSEARASLLYFENLELIRSQLSYGAAGPETSPFQHFWSLSVQGQFYLLWPLVALTAVLLAKRAGRSPILVMGVMTGLIVVVSFGYAVYMGGVSQDEAYLMTRTRFWELGFGGLLALLGSTLTLPRRWRRPAGWAGVALIITTGFLLDGAALFPGPWALWPLLGMALVLAAAGPGGGAKDPVATATRVLSAHLFTWVGDRAYALYLWHWPLLIFYLEIRERPGLGVGGAMIVLAASLVLAVLTHRWVERPVTRVSARISLRVPLAMAATVLLIGGSASSYAIHQIDLQRSGAPSLAELDPQDYPGALATLADTDAPKNVDFVPDLQTLAQSRPDYYDWGCRQEIGDGPGRGEVLVCEDPDRPADPDLTVMITGGSHAGQWHHAWRMLAAQNNWELLIADKSACIFTEASDPENNQCHEWNLNLLDVVSEREPDLVFTAGTRVPNDGSPENIQPGAPQKWQQIMDRGSEVLLMRGTPRREDSVADCLAQDGDAEACGMDPISYRDTNPLTTPDLPEGLFTVDMTEHLCFEQICPAVIGNIAVYYDQSHLSNHYVESMAPLLEAKLREAMPHLF
ncbi:acyltransferase family protein [Nesterenkonia sp. AN1]|uniref:acyltransferase family protein n=1 Tax=Nesterenkonia sp. AN1 TaxID=652017 RepID=UPI001377F693|nr:acyltransferase family protein [Nesterenkonia sp. AN1]